MRLTRRDAVAALAAAGVAVGGGAVLLEGEDGADRTGPLTDSDRGTLVAVAEVVYPEAVTGVASFVTDYLRGRLGDDPDRAAGVADAVAYLEEYTEAWYETAFVDLEPSTRDEVLRHMGVDEVEPDPAGSDVERVRYYVLNELLFALYASPTGAELVGLENPQGHPGGLTSYRRGPKT